MSRLLSCLALVVVLAACDSGGDAADAQVSTGRTYAATTLRISDAESGGFVLDLVRLGARLDLTFDDASRFTAHVAFPASALGDDGEGDLDETVTGTYSQRDGRLTFAIAEGSDTADTFLADTGWTLSPDGATVRYDDEEEGVRVEVVLTRR